MNAVLTAAAPRPLPAPDSHWREWVTYGLRWAAARPPADRRPSTRRRGRRRPLHDGARLPRSRTRSPLAGAVRRDLAGLPQLVPGRGWPPGHHYVSVAMRSPDISPNWSRPGSVCAVSAVTTRSPPGCCRCGVFPRSRSAAPRSAAGRTAGSGAQLRLRPGALRSRDCVH